MRILDLPQFAQFQNDPTVKVLRHYDRNKDLWAMRQCGTFDEFQNDQAWDVFGKARHFISFISERDRYATFVGVWRITSKRRKQTRGYTYRTVELAGFADLERRLVVRWGEGTRSWAQWLHGKGNKEVSELLPENYVRDFPGYYNFTLEFDELATIVRDPEANREWRRMLAAVSGVYVILDRASGRQYIGSAYGAGGIWARWVAYAKSRTGGNAQLKELLRANPEACRSFQFSILRVLEPHATKDEVSRHEALTKRKLGSRVFGLNSN